MPNSPTSQIKELCLEIRELRERNWKSDHEIARLAEHLIIATDALREIRQLRERNFKSEIYIAQMAEHLMIATNALRELQSKSPVARQALEQILYDQR